MLSDPGQIRFCNKDERLVAIMFKVTKNGINRLDKAKKALDSRFLGNDGC
jgi:hypothetical protein